MNRFIAIVLAGCALTGLAARTARSQEPEPRVGPTLEAPNPDPAHPDALTKSERELLERGEYDRSDIVTSGLFGSILGLGSGHYIQDRYKDTGWIYTAGELGSFAAMLAGAGICSAAYDDDDDEDDWFPDSAGCVYGVVIGTFAVWSAFRIVETIDVWAYPQVHNKKVRKLKKKLEPPPISFHVVPRSDDGATAGFTVRF